jgi:hypothetical protein
VKESHEFDVELTPIHCWVEETNLCCSHLQVLFLCSKVSECMRMKVRERERERESEYEKGKRERE